MIRSAGARVVGRAVLLLTVTAAWLLVTSPARAQLDLRWEAPASCPQRDDVLERIRALAGAALDKTTGLSAEGRITHAGGRYWLTVLVRDGRQAQKRVISSDSCANLGGAAAITLALLLGIELGPDQRGPNDASGRDASEPEPRVGGSSDRSGRDAEEPQDEPTTHTPLEGVGPAGAPATSRWALLVRAPLLAADAGPLPRPTVGVGVGLGLRYESWTLAIAGHLSRGQTVTAGPSSEQYGAELQRSTAQLTGCHGWRWHHFEIAPCLGLALEVVTARGVGEGVAPRRQQVVWPAPGAGAAAHWYALEPLAFFASMMAYLELSRARLTIDELGEVRQLPPAAAGAMIGVEWIL